VLLGMATYLEVALVEDGHADLEWPRHELDIPDTAMDVAAQLAAKGWSMLRMSTPAAVVDEAAAQVSAMPSTAFHTLKVELTSDYLGEEGRGKVQWLDRSSEPGALSVIDHDIANCSLFLRGELPAATLGFQPGGRTKSLLWAPLEAVALEPEELAESDAERGIIEDHLRFLQTRQVCLLYFLSGGGEVVLTPRPGLSGREIVRVQATANRLLAFRCNQFSYQYVPASNEKFQVVLSWILAEMPALTVSAVNGDPLTQGSLLGIEKGPEVPTGDRVHVMSINTRLPCMADSPENYYTMLLAGSDGQTEIPMLRFDVDVFCSRDHNMNDFSKIYTTHGGFNPSYQVYYFDNKFFGINDEEAQFMDPNQRVPLEVGYECLWRHGYRRSTLNGKEIGVFAGDTGSDWTFHDAGAPLTRNNVLFGATGKGNNISSGRLSFTFNLRGPINVTDTACSSSLVATHLAMLTLRPRPDSETKEMEPRLNRTEEGLCYGMCSLLGPGSYFAMTGIQALSAQGRCFTFDKTADGYARGEGCGMLFLKASESFEDSANQLATILGAACNQDGRSASMTAPNGPSQTECIKASLREADLKPTQITVAECHGTGTALGDPIEVGALRAAMEKSKEPRESALITTSSKSNIGHLEGGAGMAGLLKCVLLLMGEVALPNLHLYSTNPHLDIGGWPVVFEQESYDVAQNSAISGVSSFGWGGTNARGDVWGQCKTGLHTNVEGIDYQKLPQISIKCPISLGPIDYLSGEPVRPYGGKYRADALREPFADYAVSSYVYEGEWRYRAEPLEEEFEELPDDCELFVCGSWTGFQEKQPVEYNEETEAYSFEVVLGELAQEHFYLCLNTRDDFRIYPAVDRGTPIIWVHGPDSEGKGKCWVIDGTEEQAPVGTAFTVTFRYSLARMTVAWERLPEVEESPVPVPFKHTWGICGTFLGHGGYQTMERQSNNGDVCWECAFKIGSSGQELFQLAWDSNPRFALFPARHAVANDCSIPLRGPDSIGHRKAWLAHGMRGEQVVVQLRMVDAGFSLVVTSPSMGSTVYRSHVGWERYSYELTGTSGGQPLSLSMDHDSLNPGQFRCRLLATAGDKFQILADGDKRQAFYPEQDQARVGQCIISGPDDASDGRHFAIETFDTPSQWEVILNLATKDRRKRVTWVMVSQGSM